MAVTLLNGASTAGTPTAWTAIPEARKYFVQCFGSTGTIQFSNDGVNLISVPSVSSGGPSIEYYSSGTNTNVMVGSTNPFPFAFARFTPDSTAGAVRVTLTSVV